MTPRRRIEALEGRHHPVDDDLTAWFEAQLTGAEPGRDPRLKAFLDAARRAMAGGWNVAALTDSDLDTLLDLLAAVSDALASARSGAPAP